MVIEIGSPFKIESYRSKSFPRQELHATFARNSRIATDIASNDNDITEIQARHRGRGQIGRARHSVSLRNGDSPSRTISGGARGEEKSGEEWRRVASY